MFSGNPYGSHGYALRKSRLVTRRLDLEHRDKASTRKTSGHLFNPSVCHAYAVLLTCGVNHKVALADLLACIVSYYTAPPH